MISSVSVYENGGSCTMRSFICCTHPQIFYGDQIKENGVDRMWHAWERRGKCTGFWWENQKEIDYVEDQGVDGRMGSEWILGKLAGEM
jgi:hypothetical protein